MNIWEALYKEYADEYRDINNREELILEAKKALYAFIRREMKDFRETKPPILEREIKSPYIKDGRRVNRIEIIDEMTNEAYLLPDKGGFNIFIKKSLSYYRRRLCLAHELAHTYYYKFYDNDVPIHIVNSKKYLKTDWGLDEGFTYEIAREILLPKFVLRKFLKNKNINLSDMFKLQKIFKVPISIVAQRLIKDLRYLDSCFIIAKSTSDNNRIIKPTNIIYKGDSFKNISIRKNWKKIADLIIVDKNNESKDLNIEKFYFTLDNYECNIEFAKENRYIFVNIKMNDKETTINTTLDAFLYI